MRVRHQIRVKEILTFHLYQVDWNRVASDLEISNGHAARMRYSRFKSQMEPSSAQKNARKRNSKKREKGDPKGEIPGLIPVPMSMQMPFPMASGPVPKMEPSDSQFSSNPFVKCKPGIQEIPGNPGFTGIPDFQQHFPQTMSPSGMPYPSHMSQYVPHGMQFSTASDGSPSLSSLHVLHYENSYPSMAPPNDASMQNFSLQQPAFHNPPVITWEPPAPSQREPTPVKIEDEPEIIERIVFDQSLIKMEEGCKR